jgi:streptogramin lyase
MGSRIRANHWIAVVVVLLEMASFALMGPEAQAATKFRAVHPLTPDSSPTAITTGPDGSLWFTEAAGNKIGHHHGGGDH